MICSIRPSPTDLGRLFSCMLAVAIAFAAARPATATDLKYPDEGGIAFLLHIPDDLTTGKDPAGNLFVGNPDRSFALSFSRMDDDPGKMSIDDLAKAILAASKAQSYSSHEATLLGGNKADAYWSKITSGKATDLKLVIAKVSRVYLVLSIETVPALTASQQRLLDQTLSGIALTRLN
jgi:hypothetical protein